MIPVLHVYSAFMYICLLKSLSTKDEAQNHNSQQTDTRTENKTPHVLTYKWVLNNENTWTQGGERHTPEPVTGWGTRGGIAGSGVFGEG